MKKNIRIINILNMVSLGLAMFVVIGASIYVFTGQTWFPGPNIFVADAYTPHLGVIRSLLSRHR